MKKPNPIESKILAVLIKADDYMTTTEISKKAKISWNTALHYLEIMYDLDWTEKYASGSTIYWRAIIQE